MSKLEGKIALVTGGGRGIGAAIARRLAADGADVAVTYVHGADAAQAMVKEIEAAGHKGLAVQADAADPAAVARAVDQVAAQFGRIDILVNNAGVFGPSPVDQATIADFDRMFGPNVRGLFAAVVAAAKHMGEGGRIINIGSTNADRIPFPGGAVYAASKAAVHGLTRGFARDLGPRGITINTVQPGPVDTDMNPDNSDFSAMLKANMAIPRYAKADEIAGMVAYLAGPDTGMITGAAMNIDGGFAV